MCPGSYGARGQCCRALLVASAPKEELGIDLVADEGAYARLAGKVEEHEVEAEGAHRHHHGDLVLHISSKR